MAHPVSIHPLVIVLDSRIPGQPLTLTISQLFSPYSFLIIHLSIDSIELFSDVFQFLQDIFHTDFSEHRHYLNTRLIEYPLGQIDRFDLLLQIHLGVHLR